MLSRTVLLVGSGSGRTSARRLFSSGGASGGASNGRSSGEELGVLPLAFPTVCIWGSNTGVGKTLFSAGLAAACRRAGVRSRGHGLDVLCALLAAAVMPCAAQ